MQSLQKVGGRREGGKEGGRGGEREIEDGRVLMSFGTLGTSWLTTLTSTESEGEIHQAGEPEDREQDSTTSKGKDF